MPAINICLSSDDAYAPYLGVAVTSIVANAAPEDELHFYLLDGGIGAENRQKLLSMAAANCTIELLPVTTADFATYGGVKTPEHISVAAYYRLAIADLLSQIDRVIYLDCDVTVNRSLRELFELDLQGKIIAGAPDVGAKRMKRKGGLPPQSLYVNSGVLLMDLSAMRREKTGEKFFAYAADPASHIFMGDQQIINTVLNGQIAEFDHRWNVQTSNFVNRSDYTKKPWIIHYLSRQKPWLYGSYGYNKECFFQNWERSLWALPAQEMQKYRRAGKYLAMWRYVRHRPLFFLRWRFYWALYRELVGK